MAVALPSIGADLNIPAARLQWIVSAYSLTSVSFSFAFDFGLILHHFSPSLWLHVSTFATRAYSFGHFQGFSTAHGDPWDSEVMMRGSDVDIESPLCVVVLYCNPLHLGFLSFIVPSNHTYSIVVCLSLCRDHSLTNSFHTLHILMNRTLYLASADTLI